ncbi:hypothetical protein Tco_0968087 [Tanacetum coccineum]
MRCLKIPSKFVKSLTFGALISWGRSRLHGGTNIYSWRSTTCQNGLKRKRSPPTTPELFANFLNLSSPDSVPLVLLQVIAEPIFAMTSLQRSCLNTESLIVSPPRITHKQVGKLRTKEYGDWVKLSDPKQALRGRHLMLIRSGLSRIFEASRAHGFCPSITRASHPQLHLGIQYPNLIN